jgi:type II secretory pathway pseudopilin PulG
MGHGKQNSQKGFTLIAALLIMVLLSGVAAGLLYLVTDETKMGGNDLEANLAYYGAESGMEKMASDLGALYQQTQVPTATQIQNVTLNPPTNAMVGNINYPAGMYTINYLNQAGAIVSSPTPFTSSITTGSNSGLYALVTELLLNVTAVRPSGSTASMTRTIEVAEIPVFQFGVFCGYDCSYFAGPNFSFGGRVHTNMNLFLASGDNLVFNDKVQAYKQILTDELENGWKTSSDYGGTTWVPNASSGCPLGVFPPTGATCISLPGSTTVPGDASWSGGYPTTNTCADCGGSKNTNFPTISSGTFNDYLANATTGVTNLQLPFVTNSCVSNPPPCTDPITIIRKPLAGEIATSALGVERLYNKAQIHILIADDPADLHPGTAVPMPDGQDVQLPSTTGFSTAPFTNAAVTLSTGGTESVGFATNGASGWVKPWGDSGSTGWSTWPLAEAFVISNATPASTTGPWIRVEYCNTTSCNAPSDFVGVTQEWLQLGFGQPFDTPPTSPGTNTVNKNAILIFQELQPGVAATAANIASPSDWYPINFYDVREGEMRDNQVNNTSYSQKIAGITHTYTYSSCSINGIMNAVELDVGNLNKWLQGSTGLGTGTKVNYSNNNGYVLYFSDHRGMRQDAYASNGGQTPAGVYSGESGLEDVVNSSVSLTASPPMPDGVLETTSYYTYSPEDVDQNNQLDNWGEQNLGYGYGINSNVNPKSPYTRVGVGGTQTAYTNFVDCAGYETTGGVTQPWLTGVNDQEGIANTVSGARHALMLVDGSLGNVPVMPAASGCTQTAANPTGCGGFTVASENPVYILGNYNSSSADTFWSGGAQVAHSAASIIADAVSVLSNQWSNAYSLLGPTYNPASTALSVPLPGSTTTITVRGTTADAYYRTAIAAGKNIPFPQPTFSGVAKDFGTDGGMHNFLRYLEDWNNTLHYNGSQVSMYYSEYDTGTFKCCTVVYSPPTRDYYFDTLFLNPNNLPPATPMIQDIVNLSYHQNFTPQTTY